MLNQKNTHLTVSGFQKSNLLSLIVFQLIIIFGIYRAINLNWVCDDIYITFRYVDNFLQGYGIVYNAGERVEGYTHFLWFLLLSFFRLFKLELSTISIFLGLFSYTGIIYLFFSISRKNEGKKRYFIPFTALALSVNYDFAIWATGGLETMFYTLLISLVFYIYYFSEIKESTKLLFTGLLLALACMTRPDAVIFYLYANFLILLWKVFTNKTIKELIKKLICFNLPFVIFLLPYLIWKIIYYGDIVPNTYYVKSAGESYLSQGLFYIWLFFNSYKTTFISLASVFVILKIFITKQSFKEKLAVILNSTPLVTMIIALGAAVSYLFLFVARVGGDFMFARFIIPVLPFLYYSAETGITQIISYRKNILIVCFASVLLLIYFEKSIRDDLFTSTTNGKLTRRNSSETGGVTDERNYYYSYWEQFPKSANLPEALITTGKALQPYFKSLDITVVLGGARNYIGYYAEFKNIIIDNGLTDKYIAKLPITERGRIGHEKYAPIEYLIKRKAILGFYDKFRNDTKEKPYAVSYIRIKELGIKIAVEIIYYDKEALNTLKKRMGDNFIFTDMNLYIDDYIKNIMRTKTIDEVKNDYKNLKEFYFNFNDDPREKEILEYLSK